MKFRSHLAALFAVSLFALPAFADSMAVVNIQEIMRDSTAAKSAKDQIDSKTKSIQAQMSKKEEELQKEGQDMSKQRAVLAPDAYEKKQKEFQAKFTAAQRDVQGKRAEIDNALSGAIGEIQKAVLDITTSIAKEKGYTLIVPASQQLYYDPKLDITKDVLTRLNSTLPKITVTFKAPKEKSEE